jgi:N-acetylmuramoyl-L-alanine amidase
VQFRLKKGKKMLEIRGRTLLSAMTACLILLFCAESYPSSNSEAERRFSVAQDRLAELKKSPKRKRYRSYWMDVVRLFESVEKKHPSSSPAADACFERAYVYFDLYRYNRAAKDGQEAGKIFAQCQKDHGKHTRAPEALYRVSMIARDVAKDRSAAVAAYRDLQSAYPDSSWTEKARLQLGLKKAPGSGGRSEPQIVKRPEPEIVATQDRGVVKNVRYWSGGAYTRIVIDQDKPLKFEAFELKKPARLVFDIQNARIDDSINKEPIPVHDGILRQVRTSQNDPTTVRVVLDLASLDSYVAFPLHEPERLVIDVTGSSDENGAAPAAANGKEPSDAAGTTVPEPPKTAPAPNAGNPEDRKLSLARQLGLKIRTIAIDAGHGGHDPGAIGRGGLREKHITLDIAKRLADLVKQELDCKVVMTRDGDEFIPLEERPFIAKKSGADLFVSIHVNANRKRKTRGIETYLFGLRASDRDAMATAALENATSTKTLGQLDTEIEKILRGLTNQNKELESVELAHYIQNSLVETMRPVKGHVVNLGVKRAFFYVLVNTNMPSILAEVGFISNPDEEKLLKKDEYRQKIAEALFQGVKKFVESRNPQTAGL